MEFTGLTREVADDAQQVFNRVSLLTDGNRLIGKDVFILETHGLVVVIDEINTVGRVQVADANSAVDDFDLGMFLARGRVADVDMALAADNKFSSFEATQVVVTAPIHFNCFG